MQCSGELKPLRYSHLLPWVIVMVEYNSLQYLLTEVEAGLQAAEIGKYTGYSKEKIEL